LDRGLVAYYPFNGNANDESGNGNHGEVHGATFVGESSLKFNGSGSDYVEAKNNILPSGSNPRTIAGWVKAAAHKTGGVFGYGVQDSTWKIFEFFSYGTSGIRLHFHGANSGGSTPLVLNKWTHLVGTYDGATAKIYINGVLDHEYSTTSLATVSEKVRIGNRSYRNPSAEGFPGEIKDVRIYNRALDDYGVWQLFLGIEFEIQEETSTPRITGFAPQSGSPGTRVVLTGENLDGVEEIRFGSLEATFTVVSATSIEAYVPKGAVTGIITVKGSNGTARSALPFEVGQGSDSSLRLEIERTPNPEQLNLVILGDADTKVVIQYSDDLMFWEAIGGEIPLQEGKFTLSILADGKQLFYRVLKPGE